MRCGRGRTAPSASTCRRSCRSSSSGRASPVARRTITEAARSLPVRTRVRNSSSASVDAMDVRSVHNAAAVVHSSSNSNVRHSNSVHRGSRRRRRKPRGSGLEDAGSVAVEEIAAKKPPRIRMLPRRSNSSNRGPRASRVRPARLKPRVRMPRVERQRRVRKARVRNGADVFGDVGVVVAGVPRARRRLRSHAETRRRGERQQTTPRLRGSA
jgi:hypothetical protein